MQPFWWSNHYYWSFLIAYYHFKSFYIDKKWKIRVFFSKIHKKSKNLSYEYVDSILLITKKPGQIQGCSLGNIFSILKCTKWDQFWGDRRWMLEVSNLSGLFGCVVRSQYCAMSIRLIKTNRGEVYSNLFLPVSMSLPLNHLP